MDLCQTTNVGPEVPTYQDKTMPHLVILYTGQLDAEVNMTTLCRQMADAMLTVKDEEGKQVFPTGGTQYKFHVIVHIPICQQLKILEHNANIPSQERNGFPGKVFEVEPCNIGCTSFEGQFAVQGLEQTGFSSSGFTYQVNEFTF